MDPQEFIDPFRCFEPSSGKMELHLQMNVLKEVKVILVTGVDKTSTPKYSCWENSTQDMYNVVKILFRIVILLLKQQFQTTHQLMDKKETRWCDLSIKS